MDEEDEQNGRYEHTQAPISMIATANSLRLLFLVHHLSFSFMAGLARDAAAFTNALHRQD